ncbi:uncharacterized protein (TIGR00299 family) protein [Azospirillum fermentarium]|uniref:LarC family nickel insertion protein n=1 Tax=Azospirillum fermentarium TaxID=1233114 RepID=UPI0022272044|nr:LarC family nickel insertion protein [Azospirillum fermentarium]MCW2248163.1 uncharacterized protein (TIGR00299 family) protein [Azospirillum fermentarium]
MDQQIYSDIQSIHLDAVGGVAGDMFAAALLNARPGLWPAVAAAVAALGLPAAVDVRTEDVNDGVLTGTRFHVDEGPSRTGHHHHHGHGHHDHDHHHHHDHDHDHDHGHTPWHVIRARLVAAPLMPAVREHAVGIFTRLAEAEAAVHGVSPDDVAFHEVGAIDSLVDIVAAAALIAALGPVAWTAGPLPRGSGLVTTAHGILPVPAPATARLLAGFDLSDDDETGERITPTGAAILAWLKPSQAPAPAPRRLLSAGTGFGTRRLKRRPNILRALLFAAAQPAAAPSGGEDAVSVLRFEVDDQTGEDLAVALDRIRALPGVLDVCQWPVFGKKGRMGAAVQILARPDTAAAAESLALAETTTLGVRCHRAVRSVLPRAATDVGGVPVKVARRPGGAVTAKVEMDALAGIAGAGHRARRRAAAERAALAAVDETEAPDADA